MKLFKGDRLKCILEPLGPTLRFHGLILIPEAPGVDQISHTQCSVVIQGILPQTRYILSLGLPLPSVICIFFIPLSHALLMCHLFSLPHFMVELRLDLLSLVPWS